MNKFEKKIRGTGAVTAGKAFFLFISNEDIDDINNIVESLTKIRCINWWCNCNSKRKHETKKQEGRLLGGYDCTYGCFIDSSNGFFINTCYNQYLSNIKIIKYFNYRPRFNGISSRDNLPRIKTGLNVIYLDDKKVKKRLGFHCLLTKIQMCT